MIKGTVRIVVAFTCILFIITSCTDSSMGIPHYKTSIFLMNADGSDPQKVLDTSCSFVQIIPNSESIVFVSDFSLYTVNFDGSEVSMISDDLVIQYTYPVVSQDGNYIYVTSNNERSVTNNIYEINLINSEINQITNTTNDSYTNISYKYDILLFERINAPNQNPRLSSLISYDTESNQLDTLLQEAVNPATFRPVFGGSDNTIYINHYNSISEVYEICELNIQTNALSTITNEVFGDLRFHNNYIYLNETDIRQINVNTGEVINLGVGYIDSYPDFCSNYMIYSDFASDYDSNIYIYDLDSYENNVLIDHSYKGKYSSNCDKIVFIHIIEE
jgi:hypothetical protein